MSDVRTCERCREVIPAERIEVLPETRLCVGCSQAVGGEFVMRVRNTSLGKEGSLKKNYGDVNAVFIRKPIRPLE